MSADEPEAGGFFARWSRRKREAEAVAESAPVEDTIRLAETPPEQPEMEPDPPVEPPSLDLIDKDFDVASWLTRNVPEAWKLAALRRAWETDPAIAGFENPARDYALDWNTPGGAPGYGPLSESDNVAEMVAKIFGDAPAETPKPALALGSHQGDEKSDSMSQRLSSDGDDARPHAATQQGAHPSASGGPVDALYAFDSVRLSADAAGSARDETNLSYAAAHNSAASAEPPARIRKRGGGAMPL